MSVNKAIIVGRLGSNPEVKYMPDGKVVANFSIATSENWVDKNGDKHSSVEWHKVVVWGKLAENAAKYLGKGSEAYIEGKIKTRSYQDKENVTRYTTEIFASAINFLGSKKDRQAPELEQASAAPNYERETVYSEEDVPF